MRNQGYLDNRILKQQVKMRKVHTNLYTHKNNTSSCRFIWSDRWPFIHFVLSNFLVSSLLLFYCYYLWSFKFLFFFFGCEGKRNWIDAASMESWLRRIPLRLRTVVFFFFLRCFLLELVHTKKLHFYLSVLVTLFCYRCCRLFQSRCSVHSGDRLHLFFFFDSVVVLCAFPER